MTMMRSFRPPDIGRTPYFLGARAQRLSNGDGGQPDLLSDHHPVEVDKFTDELAVSTKLAKYGPPIVMPVGGISSSLGEEQRAVIGAKGAVVAYDVPSPAG